MCFFKPFQLRHGVRHFGFGVFACQVVYGVQHHAERRRDPDNYSGKMLLDPLTKLGIIRDDNFGAIRLELSAESEKGKRETKITITEG